MKSGYESMIWVRDKDGGELVCYLDDVKNEQELTDDERAKCMNVNLLIGTERW